LGTCSLLFAGCVETVHLYVHGVFLLKI